jgi:hypothetical protein
VVARRRIPGLVPGLPKTRQALAYAERAHSGQHRDVDGAPFIEHPAEVAALLYDADAPDHVIAAGALHDTVEKTATRVTNLRRRFGPRITTLMLAVTDDDQIADYHQRKAAEREQAASAGDEALMILAADVSRTLSIKVKNCRRLVASARGSRGAFGQVRFGSSCTPMSARSWTSCSMRSSSHGSPWSESVCSTTRMCPPRSI